MTNTLTLKTTRADEECVCVNCTCTEALTKEPAEVDSLHLEASVCLCG